MSDFELFKDPDHAARNRMVIEAVGMIEKIWSQDPPYDLKGEFWNISIKTASMPSSASATCPAVQQPGPPVFISLATPSSSSAKTAAQKAWA